jgi:hypothetical protein
MMSQPPPPPPPPGGEFGPPGSYGGPPAGYGARTAPGAVGSLVLGILGLVLCGIFTAIPAVIMGNKARRLIDSSRGQYEGRGMATAGLVMGWIGIALSIVGIIVLIILVAADPDTFDTSTIGAALGV